MKCHLIGLDEDAQHRLLKTKQLDLCVECACVLGGDVDKRRLEVEHALDVVESHSQLAQRANEPSAHHGIRPKHAATGGSSPASGSTPASA